MTDPAERFIEAAVRPLADNAELQVAARQVLEEAIGPPHEPDHESIDLAADRLSKSDRAGRSLKIAGYVTAFAIFAIVAVGTLLHVKSIKPLARGISAMAGESTPGTPYRIEDELAPDMDPAERLLLLGDPAHESKSLRWKALWDSAPERPAFFADYALAYIEEHKDLPPDFFEIAHRLAPENGWFPLVAASVLADQATAPKPRTAEEKKAKVPQTYEVKDEAKLHEALACRSKAAAMPHFETYQRELIEPRVRLLPQGTGIFGRIPAMMYMTTIRSPMMPLIHLADALHIECDRIAHAGDQEALGKLIREWEVVVSRIAEPEDFTLIDPLLKLRAIVHGYRKLAKTSELMKHESAERLNRIIERFDARNNARKALEPQRGNFADRAGVLAGMGLPMVSRMAVSGPEIHDEDLKPGRWADHEFLSKALSAVIAACLAVLAGLVAIYRYRGGELRRKLSERLTGVLAPVDWAWILGAGVVLPFSACQLVARLPLLGAREWSISATKYLPTCGLFSFAMWLLVMLPVLIARWRLAKRADFAGLHWKRGWIGWCVVLPFIVALPFVGVALLPSNLKLPVTIGLLIITQSAQIWAWVVVLRGLFSQQDHLLKRITLSRVVVPAYVFGMLLMSLAAIASHQLEEHWMRQDRLMEIAIDQPSISRYEYQMTQAVRQEFLDIFRAP